MQFCARKALIPFSLVGLFCLFWESLAIGASFLDIVGYDHYDSGKKVYVFKTRNNEGVEFSEDKVVRAADPAYDQVFKSLFTGEEKIKGYSGQDRLMSLLNSIFFPEAGENDFKIREIEDLSTVYSRGSAQAGSKGELRMDVACRCHCYSGGQEPKSDEIKLFDVEMQTSKRVGFAVRLYQYGELLRERYGADGKIPVYSLGFLVPRKTIGGKASSENGFLTEEFSDGEIKRSSYDNVESLVVDIPAKLRLMQKESEAPIVIKFSGTQTRLGLVGKQWLSLLGMRKYLGTIKGEEDEDWHLFPLCDDLDECVKSSLDVLSHYDPIELKNLADAERKRDEEFEGELKEKLEQIEILKKEKEAQSTKIEEQSTKIEAQSAEIAELKKMIAELQKQNVKRSLENLKKHGGNSKSVEPLMEGQEGGSTEG